MAANRLFAAGAVIAVMAAGTGARADFQNGNNLYVACNSGNAEDANFCLGYVAAIADVIKHQGIGDFTACAPDTVTMGQLRDVVQLFLGRHPERRHLSAESLIAQAISEAFPCR